MTLLCSFHCNARTEAIDVGSVLSGKLEYSTTLEQCRKVHNIGILLAPCGQCMPQSVYTSNVVKLPTR